MGCWSIRLFRIFGIELELHLTFLILWGIFTAVGWMDGGWQGIIWASLLLGLIFTCVVLHELGHSLTARYYRIRVSRILLLPFGGMAQFDRIPRQPRQEILISFAGPAVNLVIIVALLPFMTWPSWPLFDGRGLPFDLPTLVQALVVLNAIMGLFNLLPIFPMDGGRVLRAVLATRLSYLQATSISVNLAKLLTVTGILIAAFKLHDPLLVFLFAFIYLGGDMEYRMIKRREKTNGIYVRDLTRNHFLSIPSDSTMGEAYALFEAFHPGELLVMDDEIPRGYLTTRSIRQAVKRDLFHEPVIEHCTKKFSVLQAGWPLDPFIEMISESSQRLYPVYSFGSLSGVLDTKNLENLIASHRLRELSDRRKANRTQAART